MYFLFSLVFYLFFCFTEIKDDVQGEEESNPDEDVGDEEQDKLKEKEKPGEELPDANVEDEAEKMEEEGADNKEPNQDNVKALFTFFIITFAAIDG